AEGSVEVVRPGVVGTLERLPAALAGDDLRAPVAADVDERPQPVVAAADDHDRDAARAAGEELSRARGLSGAPCVLPRAVEDPLLLQPRERGLEVPGGGERDARRERPGDQLDVHRGATLTDFS